MARNPNRTPKPANAEDRQGDKTHAAFLDSRRTSRDASNAEVVDAARLGNAGFPGDDGRHRLREQREQHDLAEKNSELTHRDDAIEEP